MSVKIILAPLDGSPSSASLLKSSFVLAGQFDAHVRALHVRADPKAAIPLLGEGMSGALIDEMITSAEVENQEKRDRTYQLFEQIVAEKRVILSEQSVKGLSASWREREGSEDEVISHFGRLSDLILVSKPRDDDDLYATLALNAALFETGRPMLLLPGEIQEPLEGTITVCWNGSMEGARAVSASLPFLLKAEKVFVLTADTSATEAVTGENLKEYLSWQGIAAETVHFSPAGHSVGEALMLESLKLGACLMVMGGYSHSRLRELILGGVTRDVIARVSLPVLMGH